MEYDLAELGLNFKINVDTTNTDIDNIPKTFSADQGKNPKIIDVFGDKKTYRINKIHFSIGYEIASGNYGKIYGAMRTTNEECVIKEQRYYADSELVSILKEIIIQFILNKLNPDIFPKIYGIAWDKS